MVRFESDYLEGAHPRVLQRLCGANAEQTPGYGEDVYCGQARDLLRRLCQMPQADVHFLVGGTQVNRTVVAALLRPHQGAVAADTGHISVHESGAIENAGHKVLTVPNRDGKLAAEQVEALCAAHWADASREHMVQPGMVYISSPTETGTVYTREELSALFAVCRNRGLPLYIDGARLACALVSDRCDYTLADMAGLCSAFTVGGTKLGALFGEALVFTDPALSRDFRYLLKQNGGMLAKGRLLGLQFLALLEDGLYWDIGRREVALAMKLRRGLEAKGWRFLVDSPTNQQFPILPEDILCKLKDSFSWSFWQDMGGGESAVRFCTSWATREEDIDALLAAIPSRP